MTRKLYTEAIEMYKNCLMCLKTLLSVLSNPSLAALYSHSPGLKLRDGCFMLLLVYVGLAYCYQREGRLEETMYSMNEAARVAKGPLADSPEANALVDTYQHYLVATVGSAH